MSKAIARCLLIGAIIASLINLPLFGGLTLSAYFLFSMVAASAGVWLITQNAFFKVKQPTTVPVHFLLFLLLVTYVVIHGIVSANLNLVHYYWLVGLVFLFSIHYWINIDSGIAVYLLKGIAWAAILECIVVFLQYFGLVPSVDPLFRCTGTWVNPNVTALFLAMAFYVVVKPHLFNKSVLPIAASAAIVGAILLLHCRTGLFMVFLFAAGRFGKEFIDIGHRRLRIGKTILVTTAIILGVVCLCWLAFGMKQASTAGRWQIWKNCLPLIAERPIFGHGFGSFEKEYNLYVATRGLPSNDHVNTPYNDFLELAVEGGIVAVFLWGALLFTLIRNSIKNGRFFVPILAFTFLQLVNFGFEAIPVFSLLLAYMAIDTGDPGKTALHSPLTRRLAPVISILYYTLPLAALILGLSQLKLARAFYLKNEIATTYTASDAIDAYGSLDEQLNGYQRYQEAYGDAFLYLGRYRPALAHYLAAAGVCSEPGILSKCAWCYALESRYDSSRYYYTLVENMQPGMVGPRMALLNLYRRQGDSSAMRVKAAEIVAMPIRIKNARADTMRLLAQRILEEKKTK